MLTEENQHRHRHITDQMCIFDATYTQPQTPKSKHTTQVFGVCACFFGSGQPNCTGCSFDADRRIESDISVDVGVNVDAGVAAGFEPQLT